MNTDMNTDADADTYLRDLYLKEVTRLELAVKDGRRVRAVMVAKALSSGATTSQVMKALDTHSRGRVTQLKKLGNKILGHPAPAPEGTSPGGHP